MPIVYKTVTAESKEAFDKELNRLIGNGWKLSGDLQATQKVGGSALSHVSETTLSILLEKFFTPEEIKATQEYEKAKKEREAAAENEEIKFYGLAFVGIVAVFLIIEYLTKIF